MSQADFTPLAHGDPFPADWQQVRDYGTKVAQTADLIAESVHLLRRCADAENWSTETADAFRDKSHDLADDIDKARGRCHTVGDRLKRVADELDTHETAGHGYAAAARQQEGAAGGSVATPGHDVKGAEVPLTPAETAANTRRSDAIAEIARLQRLFDQEVDQARSAADAAARDIRHALHDGVRDSWWDRNAGWLKIVKTVLTAIIVVAAIVLLTVATGGTIWLVALAASVAAGLASLGISLGLARSGNGSWWDVAFDAVGVVTLGMGGLLTKIGARGLPALRAGYSTLKGSLAFTEAFSGIRLTLGEALARIPLVRGFGLRLIGHVAGDAFDAMNAARAAAETLPSISRLNAALNGGRQAATDIVQARAILADLRGLSNVPSALAGTAAQLTGQAQGVSRLLVTAGALTNIGSLSGVANAGVGIVAGHGVPDVGSGLQVIVDLIGRLR